MDLRNRSEWARLGLIAMMIFLMMACGLSSIPGVQPEPTPTPTPTPVLGGIVATTTVPNRCEGLSGELEVQILVGPADAVGLPPISIGYLPFSVTSDGSGYLVQGGGGLTYDATLTEQWGTYTVTLDMVGTLWGECIGDPGSEMLNISVEMTGEQMVEVRSQGFEGDYPWSGSHTLEVSFPLQEGAMAQGEGWAFILHLSQ